MDTTPREIWYWLTTEAWEKAKIIRAVPLDTPVSYWLHVAVAGFIWAVMLGLAFGYVAYALEGWTQERAARARDREKREAESGREPRTALIVWQAIVLGSVTGALAAWLAVMMMDPSVTPRAFWLVALVVGFAWYRWGYQDLASRAGGWYRARLKKRAP